MVTCPSAMFCCLEEEKILLEQLSPKQRRYQIPHPMHVAFGFYCQLSLALSICEKYLLTYQIRCWSLHWTSALRQVFKLNFWKVAFYIWKYCPTIQFYSHWISFFKDIPIWCLAWLVVQTNRLFHCVPSCMASDAYILKLHGFLSLLLWLEIVTKILVRIWNSEWSCVCRSTL